MKSFQRAKAALGYNFKDIMFIELCSVTSGYLIRQQEVGQEVFV